MSESPSELIAEWSGLEKEYARLEKKAQAILEASGIKDQYEIEMRIWPAMYLKDGILCPRMANPPSQLIAYHDYSKACYEQSRIAERMKGIRITSVTRGFTLPELTLMELPTDPGDPDVDEVVSQLIGSPPSDGQPPPTESPERDTTPKTQPTAEKPTIGKSIETSKTLHKVKKPTADERHIIKAINDGLDGAAFCRRMDINEVPPREGWLSLRPPKPTWPGTYEKAYCEGPTSVTTFWKGRIQRYKCYVGRKFRHLTRPKDSPTRLGE